MEVKPVTQNLQEAEAGTKVTTENEANEIINPFGPHGLAFRLRDFYQQLSAAYIAKGMNREADLFARVVDQFNQLGEEFTDLTS